MYSNQLTSLKWRWMLLILVTFALILFPFVLFDEGMNAWAEQLTRPSLRSGTVAGGVILLLALDVLLPVPSSAVSTAAGASLGFLGGLLVSAAGMTIGTLFGYVLGRTCGLPLVRRAIPDREIVDVSLRFRRGAAWALAAMRPVPVLAEASALIAGVSAVPLRIYIPVTTLANVGISAVYSAAGASAFNSGSFLLAFAAAIAIPGIAMVLYRLLRRAGD
jgi:uncharacterized membrane protein YdjX (TVP38/TMEM64 family)